MTRLDDSTDPPLAALPTPRVPSVAPDEPTRISDRPPIGRPVDVSADAASLSQQMLGRQLAHFRIEQFVGGGGMGAVFRGTDLQLGRTVAIKILWQQYVTDEDAVRRFRNEAQSAARLDHENIARVYFFGEDRGWHFIVFEFIDGINLRDWVLRDGPLPLDDAIVCVIQVAEALAHASERDVVHRDIKPSNVLLSANGKVKLVDMGLARLHQVQADGFDLTATGVTLGTFDYISPEQARDPRSADIRSDLYSLGCTLYYMLTGQPPFPEGTVLQKLLSHSAEDVPDPRLFRPDLPLEIVELLHRLLAKDPEDRFQQPRELIGQLLLAARHLHLTRSANMGALWNAPRTTHLTRIERHLPWLLPTGLLLLGLLWLSLPTRLQDDAEIPAWHQPPSATVETSRSSEKTGGPQPNRAATDVSTGGSGRGPRGPAADASSALPTATPEDVVPVPIGVVLTAKPCWDLLYERALLARRIQRHDNATVRLGPPAQETSSPLATPGKTDLAERPAGVPSWSAPKPSTTSNVSVEVPVLIVGDAPANAVNSSTPPRYASLSAACQAAAASGSRAIIELQFDGRRWEEPWRMANVEITMRAGRGYTPIVAFHANERPETWHLNTMIRMVGGQLTCEGIRWEMHASDPSSSRRDVMSLFQLESVRELVLSGCVVTVLGHESSSSTGEPSLSVLEMQAPSSATSSESSPGILAPADAPSTRLSLRDCVVRGNATLMYVPQAIPLRFGWKNGLLATSERMFFVGGAAAPLPVGPFVRIELEHVTAVVQDGLGYLTCDARRPDLMPLDLQCRSCILMTDADSPLLTQQIPVAREMREIRQQVLFSGERNFYESIRTFWTVVAAKPVTSPGSAETTASRWSLADWIQHWQDDEELPILDQVQWQQLPDANLPYDQQTPADYRLREDPTNLALDSSKGTGSPHAGFQAAGLPFVVSSAVAD